MDTIGLMLMVVVHTANIQDRDGVKLFLKQIIGIFPRLQLIWADAGYSGKLVDWVKVTCGWVLEIIKRSDESRVLRYFPIDGLLSIHLDWKIRRLSKDYEGLTHQVKH